MTTNHEDGATELARARKALALLHPNPEDDPVGPLGWLQNAIEELTERGPSADCEDPNAYWMMVAELKSFLQSARAVLAAEATV